MKFLIARRERRIGAYHYDQAFSTEKAGNFVVGLLSILYDIIENMGTFRIKSVAGSLGEELGCRYLRQKGYKILETNYCNASGRRLGEIDIVAEKGKELVFVEVKTRFVAVESAIIPEANITSAKLHKLERVVTHYLREKHCQSKPYHFDALSILYDQASKKASIRHLEHIFL